MSDIKIYKTDDVIGKGNYIGVFEKVRNTPENLHTHEFLEIVYVRSGKAIEKVDGQEYEVSHGDMIFINYKSTHSFVPAGDYSYVNISFSPETVSEAIITRENAFALLCLTAFNDMRRDADGGKVSFFGRERKEIDDIMEAMLRENRKKQTSWERVLENYLSVIITKMLRKTELVGMKESGTERMWRELTDYIEGNPNADLSLQTLASKCFYNPAYFSRIFKEKFGVTLIEYVNRNRTEQAATLLCETDLSIDTIMETSGFSDRSNFYRAFSKYKGTSPADYRKRNKK